MHRLRTEVALELCNVPLYIIDPGKVKVAFNIARSLNKHFKDIEPNVLAAVVIGFAESRLCARDQSVHFALRMFKLIRLDGTGHGSLNRPRFVYERLFGRFCRVLIIVFICDLFVSRDDPVMR